VDAPRKRISLTMKLDADASASRSPSMREKPARGHAQHAKRGHNDAATGSAMASAFAKLKGL
jgi:uncharacterized protein